MTAVLLALLVGVLILAGLAYVALLLVSGSEDDDDETPPEYWAGAGDARQ